MDCSPTQQKTRVPGQQHLPIENDFPQEIGIDAGQAHFPPDAHAGVGGPQKAQGV